MTPTTVILDLGEEKKHSVRYNSRLRDAPVSSLYVGKSILPKPFPQTLKITIEEESQ